MWSYEMKWHMQGGDPLNFSVHAQILYPRTYSTYEYYIHEGKKQGSRCKSTYIILYIIRKFVQKSYSYPCILKIEI